jgi:hypothetical protein
VRRRPWLNVVRHVQGNIMKYKLNKSYNNKRFNKIFVSLFFILMIFGFLIQYFKNQILKHINITPFINNYSERTTGLLGTLFIGFFLYNLIKQLFYFYNSKYWLKSKAVITNSDIIEKSDSDGKTYKPNITYKYIIGKTEYFSNKVYPIDDFGISIKWFIKKIVNKYHKDQLVQIHYNPQRPGESFLERKGLSLLIIMFIFCFALFIPFVLVLLGIMDSSFKLIN